MEHPQGGTKGCHSRATNIDPTLTRSQVCTFQASFQSASGFHVVQSISSHMKAQNGWMFESTKCCGILVRTFKREPLSPGSKTQAVQRDRAKRIKLEAKEPVKSSQKEQSTLGH